MIPVCQIQKNPPTQIKIYINLIERADPRYSYGGIQRMGASYIFFINCQF